MREKIYIINDEDEGNEKSFNIKTTKLTGLQPSGVMIEEVKVDQVEKASIGGYWEIKGGCDWSPDLKQKNKNIYILSF